MVRLAEQSLPRDGEREGEEHHQTNHGHQQGHGLDETDDDAPEGFESGDGSERSKRSERAKRAQPARRRGVVRSVRRERVRHHAAVPDDDEGDVETVPRVAEIRARAGVRDAKRELEGEDAVEREFETIQRAVPRAVHGVGGAVKRERRAVGEDDEDDRELEILGFHHGAREAMRETAKTRDAVAAKQNTPAATTTGRRRRRTSRRLGRVPSNRLARGREEPRG